MKKSTDQIYASIQKGLLNLNDTKLRLVEHLNNYLPPDKAAGPGNGNQFEIHTDKLLNLLEEYCSVADAPSYTELVNNFDDLQKFINNHEKELILEQSKERFYPQTNDHIRLRIRKIPKRLLLKTGWILLHITNLFRKSKHQQKYWSHRVKEQELANYQYHHKFHKYFLPYFQNFLQGRHEVLIQLNQFDNWYEKSILNKSSIPDKDGKSVKKCQELLDTITSELKTQIFELERSIKSEFVSNLHLAGTIELPFRKYKSSVVKKKNKKLLKRYQKSFRNHHIAGKAVYEYWLFEAGIRASVLDINNLIQNTIEKLEERVNTDLIPDVNNTIVLINNAIQSIQNISDTTKTFNKLSEQISSIKNTIKKILEGFDGKELIAIYDSVFPAMLESLKRVPVTSKFSAEVFRAKAINRKYPLKPVNGRQILEGMLVNSLEDEIATEGKKLQKRILALIQDLAEIQELVEVSNEYYGPKGKSFPQEDQKELIESLKRSRIKAEDFKSEFLDLVSSTKFLLQNMNLKFRQDIMISLEPGELISTDRKQRMKSIWRVIFRKSADSIKLLTDRSKNAFKWLKSSFLAAKNRYFNLRSLLGISEQKEVLSSEISNYLAETEKAIARLPQMYQRLFLIQPLTDDRFYVRREQAYKEVEKAFLNWEDQKFAPVCVVGEQGSGATTLLNFFVKELSEKYHVVRMDLNSRYLTETDFNILLKRLFPQENFSDVDELITKVNSGGPHCVIILENIQHLFLRRINGFENLTRLFYLISQSNPGIFWLCTCLQYSWKYLDNTHNISDYFADVVFLKNLSTDMLTEAILKRHRPSGFDIVFLPSEEHRKSRYFLNKRKADINSILQKEFFDDLKEYTKGNLSFAFLLWLRSVEKIEENVLFFRFRKLQLGFLRSLEVRRIITMHAILIHSGLTCEEHAEIFGSSRQESFNVLMVMTDDGILRKKNEKYILNPLLYRHIVSHLESSNFIH